MEFLHRQIICWYYDDGLFSESVEMWWSKNQIENKKKNL